MNLIFDASNLLHRTYHTSKKMNKEYASVHYFINYLKTYVEQLTPQKIFFCWDVSENYDRDNFRYELVEGYKGTRNRDESELLHQYDEIIYELLGYLGCYNIFPDRMECDDIIAWMCIDEFKDDENVVISSDKDFLQLINFNPKVKIYEPLKRKLITESNFEEHTKLKPNEFLRYKIIQGDTSDNIKGIYGFGEIKGKRAAKDWKAFLEARTHEEKAILARNVQVMDLSKGYTKYKEEIPYLKSQLIEPTKDMDMFFIRCEELGIDLTYEKRFWETAFTLSDSFENCFHSYFS